jgi:hypothetical protein
MISMTSLSHGQSCGIVGSGIWYHCSNSAMPGFVSGAFAGTTVNGTTNTALGTQTYTYNSPCPTLTYCLNFPSPVLSGNTLKVVVFYASSPSTTFTVKYGSQTLTSAVTSSAESSKIGQAFYLCNATAGGQQVQIAASTGVIIYDVFLSQFAGPPSSGCLDAAAATVGASATSLTGASITPSQTNAILSPRTSCELEHPLAQLTLATPLEVAWHCAELITTTAVPKSGRFTTRPLLWLLR